MNKNSFKISKIKNYISPILRSPKGIKFMIVSGFLIVSFLLFIAVFSDFIAPFDPYLRSLDKVQPPSSTGLYLVGGGGLADGLLLLPPGVVALCYIISAFLISLVQEIRLNYLPVQQL